ncbi:hypothetical protein H257_17731 [Aphanomyces astaci]|uniref:Uncharacterized protein n=1 Tax=Aphanomyces astaci TaxID=112090 RepID=W4FDM5_APHAT|nr:hypothetical protein H257_17731 [Aphanomyces astaci]ETV65577.1 hypothetical protein H257_17731 [Aphanomyces astaci]|eukprot:XP_009844919.1 hypothetical protein H257_17731 [Aphanomyces astaci]
MGLRLAGHVTARQSVNVYIQVPSTVQLTQCPITSLPRVLNADLTTVPGSSASPTPLQRLTDPAPPPRTRSDGRILSAAS